MRTRENSERLVPAEPVIILTLIALMLTGAVLYSRATNLQRFLEPALAVLEPRARFAARMTDLARESLGEIPPDKIVVRSTGILAHKSLFTSDNREEVPTVIHDLALFMRHLFDDPWMALNIETVIIKAGVPRDLPPEEAGHVKARMQQWADTVLYAILSAEPSLASGFADRFAATAVFSSSAEGADWVALELIPSERLHIEILERLGKYAHKPAPTN